MSKVPVPFDAQPPDAPASTNGVAGAMVPEWYCAVSCEVVEVFCEVGQDFLISTCRGTIMRVHTWVTTASWLLVGALLSSCGGGEGEGRIPEETVAPSQASESDVAAGVAQSGPAPFISFVPLHGKSITDVTAYRYVIEPKAGAASKPVDVTYRAAALERGGYTSKGSTEATVPVFGLYSGYTNRVTMQLGFADGSSQDMSLDLVTAPYVDPNGVYDRPDILKKRQPGEELGFSYFFMKSNLGGPIVMDTDGEVRWTVPTEIPGRASIFLGDGFMLGDGSSRRTVHLAMDGRSIEGAVDRPSYTNFHHNIDRGKAGLLGEFDVYSNGVSNIESVLAEFDVSGNVVKEWDFAALIGRYMRDRGDDAALFIRPDADWFHMNAAAYDPRDDSVIVSSRENFVVKVDYQSGEIKWIFGDPHKYWYSFPSLRAKAVHLEGEGRYPIGQHAVSITSDGLIMLFNNGAASFNHPAGAPPGDSRMYSAVSVYAVDPVTMKAREVRDFDYGMTIFSQICSSVYESRAGSLLINYATADNGTKARLVGIDASGRVVVDFQYESPSLCGTSWNAEPIALDEMVME